MTRSQICLGANDWGSQNLGKSLATMTTVLCGMHLSMCYMCNFIPAYNGFYLILYITM